MTITTIQKIIKIGSSRGVTIPAKLLKELGVDVGDEIELIIRKKIVREEASIVSADMLSRCYDDFRDLADRCNSIHAEYECFKRQYDTVLKNLADR